MKNIAEVKGILDTEYNEAEVMESFKNEGIRMGRVEGRAEGIAEGKAEGIAEGRAEGRIEGAHSVLIGLVKDNHISLEVAAKRAGVTEDEFKKMMDEYATNN